LAFDVRWRDYTNTVQMRFFVTGDTAWPTERNKLGLSASF